MKALTLTEPWATLMRLGEKNVETRSWRTNYRGLIAIHAAKTMPKEAKEFLRTPRVVSTLAFHCDVLPMNDRGDIIFNIGSVLCVRELIDCVPTEEMVRIMKQMMLPEAAEREICFGDYSPGRWAWVFSDKIEIISPPVPVKGSLGLWNW
jgi:hypothetical protein